jgi:hypothetical protein
MLRLVMLRHVFFGPKPGRMQAISLLIAFVFSALAFPARASDVMVAVPTGGLHMSDGSDLVLDEEHLAITAERIHLEYVIRNVGKRDLLRQASFPLPVFDRAPLEAERALDGVDAGNPLALMIRVNGEPQPVHTDRVVVGHADGMMSPVRVTRTWTQSFPAGQAVTITLDYQAAAGFNGIYPLSAIDARAVCLSETMRKAVNERISGGAALQFDVVMQTMARALPLGPAGHFMLTLDKAAPADVLSLCFPGDLRKVSATRFIATRENFTPPDTLHVLFVPSTGATQ